MKDLPPLQDGAIDAEPEEILLPKWPFVLADLGLVTTAVALAVVSGGPLTTLQMAMVLLAVFTGMVIFCAPWVIEHISASARARHASHQRDPTTLRYIRSVLNEMQAIEERTGEAQKRADRILTEADDRITRVEADLARLTGVKAVPPAGSEAVSETAEAGVDSQGSLRFESEEELAPALGPTGNPDVVSPGPEPGGGRGPRAARPQAVREPRMLPRALASAAADPGARVVSRYVPPPGDDPPHESAG